MREKHKNLWWMLLDDIKLHAGLDLEFNGGVKKKKQNKTQMMFGVLIRF